MKKSLLSALALSAVLLTSCSNEEVVTPGNDGNVIFSVALPGDFATRATISDGTKATKLSYAVYLTGTKNALFTSQTATDPQAADFSGLKTTLTLNLAKGKTYDIIFWADKGTGSSYTFNTADQTITVDYTDVASNVEDRDAFFAAKTITVTGAMEENITLKRPFAQLNFATSDLEAAEKAGFTYGGSRVTVSNVYSVLNLLTGKASHPTTATATAVPVTFGYAGLVEDKNTTHDGTTQPVKKYHWLSMNYLLTGAVPGSDIQTTAGETIDLDFTVGSDATTDVNAIKVSNVPVQRNYRTNIYGELLTSTVNFTINIDPIYNKDDNNQEVKSAGDSKTLQAALSEGGNVVLSENIDLSSETENITIGKNANLSLAGKAITGTAPKGKDLVTVNGGANVTISNGTIKDTQSFAGGSNYAATVYVDAASEATLENLDVTGVYPLWLNKGSKVTIKSGKYHSTVSQCLYVYDPASKITIEGGEFYAPLWNGKSYLINVKDSAYGKDKKGTDYVEITGGTFIGFNPAKNAENPSTSFVAEGYEAVEQAEKVTINGQELTVWVVQKKN